MPRSGAAVWSEGGGTCEHVPMARQVRSPDGRVWTVERHWAIRPPVWIGPRLRRSGERERNEASRADDVAVEAAYHATDAAASSFDLDDLGGVLIVGIALIVLAFLAVPLLIFLLDLLLIGLILFLVTTARVLFRRPWRVTARTGGPPPEEHAWRIPGLRASARAVDEIADSLEATGSTGHHAPTSEGGTS